MAKKALMLEKGEHFFSDGLSLYVNRVYEEFELPIHEHDFIEICYVWEGSGFHYIGDEVIRVTKGDVFFIPIGVPHIFRPSSQHAKVPLVIGNCIFDEKLFQFIMTLLPAEFQQYLFQQINEHTENWMQTRETEQQFGLLFERLHQEFIQKPQGYEVMLYSLLLQLFIELERAIARKEPAGDRKSDSMQRVLHYIRKHLHESMKLEDIAQSIAVGGRQLQRIVRQSSDMSLSELIQRERIKESCRLLVNPAFTQLSISDIASRVGIHDPKRFYRLFKQMTNETPGQYRKNRLKG